MKINKSVIVITTLIMATIGTPKYSHAVIGIQNATTSLIVLGAIAAPIGALTSIGGGALIGIEDSYALVGGLILVAGVAGLAGGIVALDDSSPVGAFHFQEISDKAAEFIELTKSEQEYFNDEREIINGLIDQIFFESNTLDNDDKKANWNTIASQHLSEQSLHAAQKISHKVIHQIYSIR